MKIQNRKNKLYSEKLFNELCFIFLIITTNKIDFYILNRKINRSHRTYNRYLEDIYACGILPKNALKIKYFKTNNTKYYIYDKFASLYDNEKIDYISNHLEKYHINNRLYRTCLIMLNNIESYFDYDTDENNEPIYGFEGGFSDLSFTKLGISKRTYYRDAKLVKDVIAYMYDKK